MRMWCSTDDDCEDDIKARFPFRFVKLEGRMKHLTRTRARVTLTSAY